MKTIISDYMRSNVIVNLGFDVRRCGLVLLVASPPLPTEGNPVEKRKGTIGNINQIDMCSSLY